MNSYEEHERKSKCRHFYYCEALFCPMAMVENTSWYPDEAVCDLPEYSNNIIIKNQRNIKKKHPDPDLYFSYRMLNRKFIIRSGIKGADPDLPGNITSRADTEKIYRQRVKLPHYWENITKRKNLGRLNEIDKLFISLMVMDIVEYKNAPMFAIVSIILNEKLDSENIEKVIKALEEDINNFFNAMGNSIE